MKLILKITSGPMKGTEKEFSEHDVFLAGRAPDCHFALPDDRYLSRHHFLLEINPPDIFLRDLGSKNGTFVNGIKYGGKSQDKNKKENENIDLRDGDFLKVGDTEILIKIKGSVTCVDCGSKISEEEKKDFAFLGGTYLCKNCRNKKGQKQVEADPLFIVKNRGKKIRKAIEITPASKLSKFPSEGKEEKKKDPGGIIKAIKGLFPFGPEEQKVPSEIGGYEIINILGKGGFGAVYLAKEKKTGLKVALKTMIQTRMSHPHKLELFKREIQALKELAHKNIVKILDYGYSENIHYFTLEYMDKGSLWDLMMEKGRIEFKTASQIMVQSLQGLAFAHSKEIIHRDIKPPNILISGDKDNPAVKLSDFGLAKNFARAGLTRKAITVMGQFCGSPPYMAPEHITDYRYVRPPTDVFEIGATFYHLLTGQTVWKLYPGMDPYLAILQGKIKPVRELNPSIPEKVAQVLDRSLSRKSEKRYRNGDEMAKALIKAL